MTARRTTRQWVAAFAAAVIVAGTAWAQPQQEPDRPADGYAIAIFAGGCFWCVEEAFDEVAGVVETVSGYIGGEIANPTYEQVVAGRTGHAEAVRVRFDPAKVTYAHLLDVFWRNVDPFDGGGQFCDRGASYRSAIFVATEEQKGLAETSKAKVAEHFNQPVATEIVTAGPFYMAEAYHQDYHHRNPLRYKLYKWNCGRAQRLQTIWGEKKGL